MKTYDRILALFELLPAQRELTAAQIFDVTGPWFPCWDVLAKLETEGKLTSRFVEGPFPRRRVYKVVR